MRTFGIVGLGIVVVTIAALYIAWVTAKDPKFNPASFEDKPLMARLAPIEEATTLAQYLDEGGSPSTMVVISFSERAVTGIDLRELGASNVADPFEALAGADISPIINGNADGFPVLSVPFSKLLPSGSSGTSHIGTGTNFPEHAEEANSSSVFQFPKFGPASPARTKVNAVEGVLLDYEVELCVRFDRDLQSPADFDDAVKAFFICGDFTNRNALINLADTNNLNSGYGFSDAKSGPDFFPTGPFLVVPKDWVAFVDHLRMTTNVNGEPRQDARGKEMTLDFRQLVEKAFGDMSEERFLYRNSFVPLTNDNRIDRSSTVMSGTAEGTIFTPPSRRDLIEATCEYLLHGGPFGDAGFLDVARKRFIENELAGGHFLQPGDLVTYDSNYLGSIQIQVVN